MTDDTETALTAKAFTGRISQGTYRSALETRAKLAGWVGARRVALLDTETSDAVAIAALDGLLELIGQWAAQLDEIADQPAAELLGKITVHPDETGQGRVRASHPDDGTYVIKSVAFPAGQSVTLAQIVAEFEASNDLPISRKGRQHG